MRLRNKLSPLRCLPRGLLFLKLENCDLTGYDLKFLKQSHHENTLLHLNISNNSQLFFSQESNNDNMELQMKISYIEVFFF